jgi:hypothetical protein
MTNDLELLSKKEVRETAIEFAMYLMTKSVNKASFSGEVEEYNPKEFQLAIGNLLNEGNEIYGDFIKELYKVEAVYKLKK